MYSVAFALFAAISLASGMGRGDPVAADLRLGALGRGSGGRVEG